MAKKPSFSNKSLLDIKIGHWHDGMPVFSNHTFMAILIPILNSHELLQPQDRHSPFFFPWITCLTSETKEFVVWAQTKLYTELKLLNRRLLLQLEAPPFPTLPQPPVTGTSPSTPIPVVESSTSQPPPNVAANTTPAAPRIFNLHIRVNLCDHSAGAKAMAKKGGNAKLRCMKCNSDISLISALSWRACHCAVRWSNSTELLSTIKKLGVAKFKQLGFDAIPPMFLGDTLDSLESRGLNDLIISVPVLHDIKGIKLSLPALRYPMKGD